MKENEHYTTKDLGLLFQKNSLVLEELQKRYLPEEGCSKVDKGDEPRYVRWGVFIAVVTLIVTIISGSLLFSWSARADAVEATLSVSQLEGRISTLENDINWIKNTLEKIDKKL